MDLSQFAEYMATQAMARIRNRRGARAMIATELGQDHQSIDRWYRVPHKHVFTVARLLKVKPESLRPDFFIDDPLRAQHTAQMVMEGLAAPAVIPKAHRKLGPEHKAIWRDLRYLTAEDALVAIEKDLGYTVDVSAVRRLFGPSGRTTAARRAKATSAA